MCVAGLVSSAPAFAQKSGAGKGAGGPAGASAAGANAAPGGGAGGPSSTGGATPTKQQLQEARAHYMRGVQLYNDGDFKLALIEFTRSYDLAPTYKILYNIGEVNLQLNNYASSLEALERYLKEGGTEVPKKRKTQVEKDIEGLRARTAHLTVTSNVAGAEIAIDEAAAGAAPINKKLVDAGDHKVTASKDGYVTATQNVTLAGGDESTVNVELQEVPPTPTAPTASSTNPNPPYIIQQQPPPPPPPEKPSYLWVGYAATGVLAVGAVVTGVVAVSDASSLKNERNSPTATRDSLDSAESKARTFALVADVCTVAAVVVGGVTLYFTFKKPSSTASASVGAVVGPGSLGLRGHF